MPLISIAVPTYNGAPYVAQTIQSVLKQTRRDFELTVVDDHSNDQTGEIVSKINDDRLKYTPNQERKGLVGNWNRCIIQAKNSKYTSIFHQDDLMAANHLEKLIDVLESRPNVGFAFSDMNLIDENGKVVGGHWHHHLPKTDMIYAGHDFFTMLLKAGNVVPCSSVIAKTQCYEQCGVFDQRLQYTPDLEMWMRLSLHFDVAYVAQPLVSFRRHSHQESNNYIGKIEEIQEVWQAIQIVFKEQRDHIINPEKNFKIATRHLQRWTKMFVKQAIKRGKIIHAVRLLDLMRTFYQVERRGLSKNDLTPKEF